MSEIQKHKFIGTFPKKDITRLAGELERRHKARRDYIFAANALAMTAAGTLVLSSRDTFKVGNVVYTEYADAENAANAHREATGEFQSIEPLGKSGDLPVSDHAESQLATRLEIPIKYIRSLRGRKHSDLAAHNFTELLKTDDRRFMVRTLDGQVRAVLSDRYRCMDNGDLFYIAAENFGKVGAEFWTARLWDNGFQMLGVAPGIHGKVTTDRTFDPGDGWRSRWYGTEGDVHNCAVSITNSETGNGGLNVEPSIMRRVCENFCVWADSYGLVHIGRKAAEDGLLKHLGLGDTVAGDSASLISDDTRRAEDRVIMMKIRDVITGAFDAKRFTTYIDKLNGATQQEIKKPEKAVENVAYEFGLSDERRQQILAELLGSGDRSRYGLVNAVTFAAHAADDEGACDQASELEAIGANLIDMEAKDFDVLAERNPPAKRKALATA